MTTCTPSHRGELGEEALRGAEEERAVEAVGDDVLVEQRRPPRRASRRRTRSAPFGDRVRVARDARSASSAATAIPISTATMRSNATVAAAVSTSTTASDAGGAQHHAHVVDVDHAHRGDHQHAGERGERDARDERRHRGRRRRASTTAWMIADRRVRPPDAHVHRGAGDRAGGGHAAEQRRDEVGEALAEQLAVGIVRFGVAHAVGDLGREQALEPGEQRHRERGRHQLASCSPPRARERTAPEGPTGASPMRGALMPVTPASDRRRRPPRATSRAARGGAGRRRP